MKLIFALGNPEARYDGTRHNIGFLVVDEFAMGQMGQGSQFQQRDKFKAQVAECMVAGEKILLAKPTTYYNLVGESARAIIDFYKLNTEDILIIHDDLNLPLGTIRTRIGGSDGGNNGIKSLNTHIGEPTARLRIGTQPKHTVADAANFVLSPFSRTEAALLPQIIDLTNQLITHFATGDFAATTHHVSPPAAE